MKWFQNFISIFFITVFIISCGNFKKIPVTERIPISEYTAYVFRLCEYRNSFGNKRYFLCDAPCEPTNVQANNDIQVVEELYAFQSKTNPEKIIYITSKSDKYILEDRGIFNAPVYKKHIVASDFEYVYFGNMTNNSQIKFVNPIEELSFWLKPVPESCRFVVDSIYSETAVKNAISNKKLSLYNLFNVDVQFIATDRTLIPNRKDSLDLIKTLNLKDGKMHFEANQTTYSMSQSRRLKYHPTYDATHDSIVEKIIKDSISKAIQLEFQFDKPYK